MHGETVRVLRHWIWLSGAATSFANASPLALSLLGPWSLVVNREKFHAREITVLFVAKAPCSLFVGGGGGDDMMCRRCMKQNKCALLVIVLARRLRCGVRLFLLCCFFCHLPTPSVLPCLKSVYLVIIPPPPPLPFAPSVPLASANLDVPRPGAGAANTRFASTAAFVREGLFQRRQDALGEDAFLCMFYTLAIYSWIIYVL